jgi:hypothetical protein
MELDPNTSRWAICCVFKVYLYRFLTLFLTLGGKKYIMRAVYMQDGCTTCIPARRILILNAQTYQLSRISDETEAG